MFDDGVLRMGMDPAVIDDQDVAAQIANDVDDSVSGLFDTGEALIEVRGARALRTQLQVTGWIEDEPWASLTLDLSGDGDTRRDKRANLRVERVGVEVADRWTSVHWSAFKGTAFDGPQRDLFIRRWLTMMTGPLADRAHNLIGYDSEGIAVAVATVWTAGNGRPGLVEPLGVHREHHGRGYGAAMALAAAHALKRVGASSANVAAECSNPAAIATYLSAGFVSLGTVADLRRN